MIYFKTQKREIEEAMGRLNVIIPTRDAGTLLSNVLLSVDDDAVSITASDMESTVRIIIPAENTQKGDIIVKGKKLGEIASALKSEDLIFSAEEQEVHEGESGIEDEPEKNYLITIRGGAEKSVKYRMPGDFRSHFPGINTISEDKLFTLPSVMISEMIHKAFYSVSQEENRYIYSGLYIEAKEDQLNIVGTDGRRLAAVNRKLEAPIQLGSEELGNIVVYSKAIKELQQILDTADEVQIGVEQKDIFFRVGNAELSSRLLEGKFPDYTKVIPKETNINFKLNRSILLDALKEVMVMTEQPSFQVRMTLQKDELLLEANTLDMGESEKPVPIKYDGDTLNVCFNGSYLRDILTNIEPNEILIAMEDENKPIVIHDLDDKDFISLIMPMRT